MVWTAVGRGRGTEDPVPWFTCSQLQQEARQLRAGRKKRDPGGVTSATHRPVQPTQHTLTHTHAHAGCMWSMLVSGGGLHSVLCSLVSMSMPMSVIGMKAG